MKALHCLACSALSLSLLAGCGVQILAIEVLPPRVAPSCSAPSAKAPAFGRGLLDLDATADYHGAYFGDLRISAASDVLIDGIRLGFDLPDGLTQATHDAAKAADGEIALGDVLLEGDDDEVRQALLENVELLPRHLAKALSADSELSASATQYATIGIELWATSQGQQLGERPATFAVDVCQGCLTDPPPEGACEYGNQVVPVCRPGQEHVLWGCADPPSNPLFP